MGVAGDLDESFLAGEPLWAEDALEDEPLVADGALEDTVDLGDGDLLDALGDEVVSNDVGLFRLGELGNPGNPLPPGDLDLFLDELGIVRLLAPGLALLGVGELYATPGDFDLFLGELGIERVDFVVGLL